MAEEPRFEGPLRNPDVSEEADRELDKAMDRLPAAAARRLVSEFAVLEEDEPVIRGGIDASTVHHSPGKPASSKPKTPINRPSRNSRIYDRDRNVADFYDSIDPLK